MYRYVCIGLCMLIQYISLLVLNALGCITRLVILEFIFHSSLLLVKQNIVQHTILLYKKATIRNTVEHIVPGWMTQYFMIKSLNPVKIMKVRDLCALNSSMYIHACVQQYLMSLYFGV